MRLTSQRDKLNSLLARREAHVALAESYRRKLKAAKEEQASCTEAQEVVQVVAQEMQQRAHERIGALVSSCLAAVFDDPYEFKFRFDRKRGKTEAAMVFVRDGVEYDDPMNEIGGGVIDVVALTLRVANILAKNRRRLIVADEPLRNVRGRRNKSRIRNLLVKLHEDMEMQFVLNVDADAYPEFALGDIKQLGVE